MDYLKLKRKARNRRLIFGASAVFLGIGLAGFLSFANEPQNLPKISASTVLATPTDNNWQLILQNLDQIRASAIMQRDKSQLEKVYEENSDLATNDFELIEELIETNSQITGLSFNVESVKQISHRWSNDEEVVELQILDSRSAYQLQNDFETQTIPKRNSTNWIISLVKVEDGWLVGNAVAESNNR